MEEIEEKEEFEEVLEEELRTIRDEFNRFVDQVEKEFEAKIKVIIATLGAESDG